MRLANLSLLSLLVGVAQGCAGPGPVEVPVTHDLVYMAGTDAYRTRAAELKIPPSEVRAAVAKETGKPPGAVPNPSCIVGRQYSWPMRRWGDRLDLWGPRLDGDTGKWAVVAAEDYPFYVPKDWEPLRVVPLRLGTISFPDEWARDGEAEAERKSKESPANGSPVPDPVRIESPARVAYEVGAGGRLERASFTARCDPALPKAIAGWTSGSTPTVHVTMELWNVKTSGSPRLVRVFINTPAASTQSAEDEPGYVETMDIYHFDTRGVQLRWVLHAGPAVRRLVKLGRLDPTAAISVQLVPIYDGRSSPGAGLTLDGATLKVDD